MKRKGSDHIHHGNTINTSFVSSTDESIYELLNNVKELYEKDGNDTNSHLHRVTERMDELNARAVDEMETLAKEVKDKIQLHIEEDEKLYREHEREMEELEKEIEDIRKDIADGSRSSDELEREIQDIQRRIQGYIQECAEEVEKIDEVEHARMSELPKLKHFIRLQAMITNIKWDYERGLHSSHVLKGTISIPSRQDIARFCLDTSECSEYEVADYFWKIIGGQEVVTN